MSTHYPAFSAPPADEAYKDAPEIDHELEALRDLGRQLRDPHEADGFGGASAAEAREVLLRLAAVADRLWWRDRTAEAGQKAEKAAFALQQHDLRFGEDVAGPIGPGSVEWDAEGGTRAYVRQEYWWWFNVPPECGNCPPEDPCPWHAEHGER